MANATYNKSLMIAGINFARNSNITADGANGLTATITPAKALSSWVKTDSDTAAGNLAGGHGWSTGTFDVYWTGGKRLDVTVTITTNACALDGGTGDAFPASADTTVVLAKRTAITGFTLDGDNASIVAADITSTDPSLVDVGRISFRDASDNIIEEVPLTTNGDPNINDIYSGEANRYTGAVITNAFASTAYTGSTSVKANIGYLFDATL